MKENRDSIVASTLTLATGAAYAWHAYPDNKLVKLPVGYAQGGHPATAERGNIREEIFANRVMIDAAKSDQPIPSDAVTTLFDYRDGALYRCVVMEKAHRLRRRVSTRAAPRASGNSSRSIPIGR